jgi:hypothetical protein
MVDNVFDTTQMSQIDTVGPGVQRGSVPTPADASPPTRPVAAQIADLLVEAGHLSADELRLATRIHVKDQGTRTLISVLMERKSVSQQQIRDVLRSGTVRAPLGDLLVELGLLNIEELKLALAMQQERPSASLDEVLVDNHFVSKHELNDLASSVLR